jgi:hypothetical protein
MHFENFGEGYSPRNKFFIDETPKSHFLGSIQFQLQRHPLAKENKLERKPIM